MGNIHEGVRERQEKGKHGVGSNMRTTDYTRMRRRSERAYQRLEVQQNHIAEAWGIDQSNVSRRANGGGHLFQLALEIHTAELAGIDTTSLLTFLKEIQTEAKANALTDDELLQKLHTALYDEVECEAVENKSALHFQATGCYPTLIEGAASENAVQTKVVAFASLAHLRKLPWRAK